MLKEVGASGQISLGKKYAGQLFDLQTQPDGTIVLQPMRVVPAPAPRVQEEPVDYAAQASPTSQDSWAEQNAPAITQYNAWAAQQTPYS